jgi:phage tail tape-measure protein
LDRETDSSTVGDGENHATTGGAAAAGAVTGGVIGLTGGPIGAAIGAVGGAIVGAAAERMMHSDDDAERARAGLENDQDRNPLIEERAKEPMTGTSTTPSRTTPTTPATRADIVETEDTTVTERRRID